MEGTEYFLISISGSLARVFVYPLHLARVFCHFQSTRNHVIIPPEQSFLYPHSGPSPAYSALALAITFPLYGYLLSSYLKQTLDTISFCLYVFQYVSLKDEEWFSF